MLAICHHAAVGGIKGEELLLANRRIARQVAAGGRRQPDGIRALHFLEAAGQAETEALEGRDRKCLEWLKEHARLKGFIIFEIRQAGIARIPDAGKNAGGITGYPLKEVPVQFE